LEKVLNERDQLIKKAGKKGKEVEDKLGVLDSESFNRLPEKLLIDLLKERAAHPECAAGIIFDNLGSSHF